MEILEDLVVELAAPHLQLVDLEEQEILLKLYQDRDIQALHYQCPPAAPRLLVAVAVEQVVQVGMKQMVIQLVHLLFPEVMVDQEDSFLNFQFLLLGKQFHQQIIQFGTMM
jgi:hypothetical protein